MSGFLDFKNFQVGVLRNAMKNIGLASMAELDRDQIELILNQMAENDPLFIEKNMKKALGVSDSYDLEKKRDSVTVGNSARFKVTEPPMWKGGTLVEWKKWITVFHDIAIELEYDQVIGARRLRRYTVDSPDYVLINSFLEKHKWEDVLERISEIKSKIKKGMIISKLSDVNQGRDDVSTYLTRFLENKYEI